MCRSWGDNGDDFLNAENDDEGLGDEEQGNEGMVEVEDEHPYDGIPRQIRLFEEMYPRAILPRRNEDSLVCMNSFLKDRRYIHATCAKHVKYAHGTC